MHREPSRRTSHGHPTEDILRTSCRQETGHYRFVRLLRAASSCGFYIASSFLVLMLTDEESDKEPPPSGLLISAY